MIVLWSWNLFRRRGTSGSFRRSTGVTSVIARGSSKWGDLSVLLLLRLKLPHFSAMPCLMSSCWRSSLLPNPSESHCSGRCSPRLTCSGMTSIPSVTFGTNSAVGSSSTNLPARGPAGLQGAPRSVLAMPVGVPDFLAASRRELMWCLRRCLRFAATFFVSSSIVEAFLFSLGLPAAGGLRRLNLASFSWYFAASSSVCRIMFRIILALRTLVEDMPMNADECGYFAAATAILNTRLL
mmetsp:Transcript_107321/g.303422  ORF Transcript_107321/g.303422 Transcript_107321/m.303422 type:complete len:238 (-) Transcript_107321:868-1581(-)